MGWRDSPRLRAVAAFLAPALGLAFAIGLYDASRLIGPQRYLHYGLWDLAARILAERLWRPAVAAALVALVMGLLWPRVGALLGRKSAVAGAVLAALVLGFGAVVYQRGEVLARGPDVFMIGVDTLRADHLSLYGYERETSPRLDAWARSAMKGAGAVLENCIVSTPRTTQSLASILTGRYPYRTGVRHLRDRLPDAELSLAEVMKNAGYTTIAVIATGIPQGKLEQGFDLVIDTKREWPAAETVDRTLAALDGVSGKVFLFVFFRDPHMPYEPVELHFDQEYEGPFRKRLGYQKKKGKVVFENDFDPRLREHAVALYDSEIRSMDAEIGRLLDALDARRRERLAIFYADHGESLGEHDYYYDHGDLLYQDNLRIPCVVEGIDLGAARIAEVTRSVDLMPTLLGGLGIELRNAELDGVDLARPHGPLEAFSETGRALLKTAYKTGRRHVEGLEGRLRSLVSGRMKLIYIPKPEGKFDFELYDLEADPGELRDLTGEAEADELKKRLLSWVARDRKNWAEPEGDMSAEDVERLRQLGYL